ncbi:hypothetical protein ACQKP0_18560 [Heyndrickxia sp. NPDC080065]|uniref:hypothetical protein n=1 Tax=Heyndrickxia sp. NPDC080065 TaxID=3390568 RepID=UPI003CFEFDE0
MPITLPHNEESNDTTYIPPEGDYETFIDDSHYEAKVREWGLSTTKEVKKQFWYKDANQKQLVHIKGYEVFGNTEEYNTIIIEFQDGNLSCIHPAYLKEMQSPSFGKAFVSSSSKETSPSHDQEKIENSIPEKTKSDSNQNEPRVKKVSTKKAPKLDLPTEKVHFTAVVKQFALSWNNFNEENDEVVVLENIVIHQEKPIEVDYAWCSHSKTLKKFELKQGETLEFDGKIVKKKLPKGKDIEEEFIVDVPVHYKINNPSKITKS